MSPYYGHIVNTRGSSHAGGGSPAEHHRLDLGLRVQSPCLRKRIKFQTTRTECRADARGRRR